MFVFLISLLVEDYCLAMLQYMSVGLGFVQYRNSVLAEKAVQQAEFRY